MFFLPHDGPLPSGGGRAEGVENGFPITKVLPSASPTAPFTVQTSPAGLRKPSLIGSRALGSLCCSQEVPRSQFPSPAWVLGGVGALSG